MPFRKIWNASEIADNGDHITHPGTTVGASNCDLPPAWSLLGIHWKVAASWGIRSSGRPSA
ncbi:hypothetical protein ACNRC9_01420, partial [Ralstonia pseudosolanacearum]|uniref:hypothetical protein n=1 Tax=Ralstonia pseudosolanacearum TaxID=1310165 RepID=UPI003AAAD085